MEDTPVLILAGGASSRMGGRDKLAEDVDGTPLLRLQAERALQVSSDVTVLMRPNKPALRQILADLPLHLLAPQDALEGIGGSVRAATRAMAHHDRFLLMLADLVEITSEDLRTLCQAVHGHPDAVLWRGATADGKPGHPILISRDAYPVLMQLQGDQGGLSALRTFSDRSALVPLEGQRARLDLDTQADWAAWRAARSDVFSNKGGTRGRT